MQISFLCKFYRFPKTQFWSIRGANFNLESWEWYQTSTFLVNFTTRGFLFESLLMTFKLHPPPSSLLIHQKTHSSKTFQCVECPSSFRRVEHLKRHEKIHTGEKPFVCGKCEKCFASSSQLFSHQRTHSSGKKAHVKLSSQGSSSKIYPNLDTI